MSTIKILKKSFEKFNDPNGNPLVAINRDGTVLVQGIDFPDGTVQTTAGGGATSITAPSGLTVGDLGSGFKSYTTPMTVGAIGTVFALQDSPLIYWDFSSLGLGLLGEFNTQLNVNLSSGGVGQALSVAIQATVNITANTAQFSGENVVGVLSDMDITGGAGQTVDEIHGFETSFEDVSGVTTNEYLAFRVHFTGSGGTRLSHIAFCGNTSATNFTLNKGVFISANYGYGLDLAPTVANAMGTAPICHSTQTGRRTAPTLLDGWYSGIGSPEGAVTANVGSFYSRRDGGTSTSFYVKETGTGNTGWIAK